MDIIKKTAAGAIAAAVFAAALAVLFCISTETAFGDTTYRYGTVTAGKLYVRKGPGTSYAKMGSLTKGKAVTIKSTKKDKSKSKWYGITYKSKTGYVSAEYIKLKSKTTVKYSPVRKGKAKDKLNIRKGTGTKYAIAGTYEKGKTFTIYEKITLSSKDKWYRVKYKSKSGYVSAAYVGLISSKSDSQPAESDSSSDKKEPAQGETESAPGKISYRSDMTDTEFVNYLKGQGFPTSYNSYLKKLHNKHKKWVFVAQDTKMTWKKALAVQSRVGMNLLDTSQPEAWKGMVKGAYDFDTGKYKIFDGSWNQASIPVIKYYLDPRNGLNEANIYEFMTHAYSASSQNENTVKSIVSHRKAGCFMNTSSYIKNLNEAGKAAKVNPNVITAMVIMEQGWTGGSDLISGNSKYKQYKGIYNHFNIGAYTTSTMSAVEHGLWWAAGAGKGDTSYGRPWNSIKKSLKGGALLYSNEYLANKQKTYYLKKFNMMNGESKAGTHQYSTCVYSGMSEGQLVSYAYEAKDNYSIRFLIPVYSGLPDKACSRPGTTGNNNCFLKNLGITGYKLSPAFDKFTKEYTVTVDEDVKSVNITAAKLYSKATVSGTGEKSFTGSSAAFKIKVTATSGMTKTYTITVKRK